MHYRNSFMIALAVMVCSLGLHAAVAQFQSATYIRSPHRPVLAQWLKTKPALRLATEADCKSKEGLAATRQERGKNYQPYYALGDFNRDGQGDFAVALINEGRRSRRFAIAVFNGPFDARRLPTPNFFTEGTELSDGGLVVLTGDRLVAGVFQSDNCLRLVPRHKTYVMKSCL